MGLLICLWPWQLQKRLPLPLLIMVLKSHLENDVLANMLFS